MKEVASVLPLVFVNLCAKPDVPFGLLDIELELRHPLLVVPIHVFVSFLELGEERTRWRPDVELRLVCDDRLPCFVPISRTIKVEAVNQVHSLSGNQAPFMENGWKNAKVLG